MKQLYLILLLLSFINLSCEEAGKSPEYDVFQQKLYSCLYPGTAFPENGWILFSGSEFTLSDFIIIKPLHKDSLTLLSCKFAITDTSYTDIKSEFAGNSTIVNDITGQEFKVFFTNTIKKNVAKKEIQFKALLRKAKKAGDSPCYGFDVATTNLTEFAKGKSIKMSTCKGSIHPVQIFYDNVVKILNKI